MFKIKIFLFNLSFLSSISLFSQNSLPDSYLENFEVITTESFSQDFNNDNTEDKLIYHFGREYGVELLCVLTFVDGKTKTTSIISIYLLGDFIRGYIWKPNSISEATFQKILEFVSKKYKWFRLYSQADESFKWLVKYAQSPITYNNDTLFMVKKIIPDFFKHKPQMHPYIVKVGSDTLRFLNQLDLGFKKQNEWRDSFYWTRSRNTDIGYIYYGGYHTLLRDTCLTTIKLENNTTVKLYATYNGLYIQSDKGYAWIYISDPVVTKALEGQRRFNTRYITLIGKLILFEDYLSVNAFVYDLETNEIISFDKDYSLISDHKGCVDPICFNVVVNNEINISDTKSIFLIKKSNWNFDERKGLSINQLKSLIKR